MSAGKCPYCGGKVKNGMCHHCGIVVNLSAETSAKMLNQTDKVKRIDVKHKKRRGNSLLIILICVILLGMIGFAVLMTFPFIYSNVTNPEVMEKVGISVESGNDEEQIKAFNEKGCWPSGMYKVGEEIPEGTYIMVVDGRSDELFPTSFYAKESVNGENNIISDTWAENTRYITLKEPGYINVSWSIVYDIQKNDIENNPYEHSGMFLVGKDIDPGTYEIGFGRYYESVKQSPHESRYTVYSDVDAVAPIVKSQGKCVDNPKITLQEGEYLKLEKCVVINKKED